MDRVETVTFERGSSRPVDPDSCSPQAQNITAYLSTVFAEVDFGSRLHKLGSESRRAERVRMARDHLRRVFALSNDVLRDLEPSTGKYFYRLLLAAFDMAERDIAPTINTSRSNIAMMINNSRFLEARQGAALRLREWIVEHIAELREILKKEEGAPSATEKRPEHAIPKRFIVRRAKDGTVHLEEMSPSDRTNNVRRLTAHDVEIMRKHQPDGLQSFARELMRICEIGQKRLIRELRQTCSQPAVHYALSRQGTLARDGNVAKEIRFWMRKQTSVHLIFVETEELLA